MSTEHMSQLCVPVTSLAQAAAVAADVSEEKLINLDTSSQSQSYLPASDPPTKTGTHLGVHPPAVRVIDTSTKAGSDTLATVVYTLPCCCAHCQRQQSSHGLKSKGRYDDKIQVVKLDLST